MITIVAFIIVLFWGADMRAEQRAGAFSLNPMIGGYLFEGDQDIRHRPAYGLGLGYNFDENFSTEVSFSYIDSESREHRGDVDGYLYRLDALYHFMPSNKLVPYLAAGVGGITLKPDRGSTDSNFLINYGAGLKYFVTENMALRGDARHLVTFPENNLLYTVGLTYYFGGKKKAEKSAPPKDSDGDGVYDDMDRCPDTPRGVKVDASGCPLDSDGDGVYDYLDKCPDTPKGASVDNRGCWILKNVYFDTDKWDIKPKFYAELDKVVSVLRENPSLKIEIQGHTDNVGTARYNQKLSEKRANAVMQYLLEKGTAQSRLNAVGFGFRHPAASNDTPEGRAKNRRIELKLIR
jgi:OOP family OmpA-OmpF porin